MAVFWGEGLTDVFSDAEVVLGYSGLKMHLDWRPVLRGKQTDTCREDRRPWEAL